jgi:undecaprenyl-diphosphatase
MILGDVSMHLDFLLILRAIIIGIVEGITEFLPISSTGHMILVGNLIGFNDKNYPQFANLFEIFIQFGAVLSVIVLFRKKIWASFKALRPGQFGFRLWLGVIMAIIPSGIVAALFYKRAEAAFMKPLPVALALLVGGVIMIITERIFKNNSKTKKAEDVTALQGFVIGVCQCVSFLWPGFSRSASTIIGGWFVGLTTAAAAEFTFFLAIPTMFAASGYSLLDSGMKLSGNEILALIIGFVVSFVVALFVVKKFIDYLQHKPLRVFAIYRIIVGVVILVLAYSTNILNLH